MMKVTSTPLVPSVDSRHKRFQIGVSELVFGKVLMAVLYDYRRNMDTLGGTVRSPFFQMEK